MFGVLPNITGVYQPNRDHDDDDDNVNAYASDAAIIIIFDSQAHVIQTH